MWLQRFTSYLLKHRYQTIAFTFVITFVPIIGIIGILIAALVTLCKGIIEGAILTIAATLPYIISFFFTGNHKEIFPLVVWAAVGVAVLSNVLTWVFAVMLRRQTSWSLVLQIAALLGVLVVSIVHLAYPSVADWWGTELQSYYAQARAMATGIVKSQATGQAHDVQVEMINVTKQFATGLMIAAILFNAILQLIIARWWQGIVFHPGILRKELHRIRLGRLAGLLFVFSLVFSYLGNNVVLDVMPIIYILFAAAGLSLIHYLFGLLKSGMAWFWLTIVYVTLILSLPTSLVLISILALLDIWFDVRKQLKKMQR